MKQTTSSRKTIIIESVDNGFIVTHSNGVTTTKTVFTSFEGVVGFLARTYDLVAIGDGVSVVTRSDNKKGK